jgi:hypothetical protein
MTTGELKTLRGSETGGARVRCTARTKAGYTCGGWSVIGDPDGFCWSHSQRLADKRKAGQRRGGQVTSNRLRALTGLIDFESARGPNRFREALCVSVVRDQMASGKARDLSAIVKDAEDSRRAVDFDDRLSALEAQIGDALQQREAE